MKIEKKHLLDYTILIPYLILSIVGLIVVYSTASARLVAFGSQSLHICYKPRSLLVCGILVLYFFIYRTEIELSQERYAFGCYCTFEILLLSHCQIFHQEINGANDLDCAWSLVFPNQRSTLRSLFVWFCTHFSKTVCYRTL